MQKEMKSIENGTKKNKKRNKYFLRIPFVAAVIISAVVMSLVFNQNAHKQNKNKNELFEEFNDMFGI